MTPKAFEVIATSTGHSFGVYSGVDAEAAIAAMLADAGSGSCGPADDDVVATEIDVLARAYAAGHEDGQQWANEVNDENGLRAARGDEPINARPDRRGWSDACINAAGAGTFAEICGLTSRQAEERGDAWDAACAAYDRGGHAGAEEALAPIAELRLCDDGDAYGDRDGYTDEEWSLWVSEAQAAMVSYIESTGYVLFVSHGGSRDRLYLSDASDEDAKALLNAAWESACEGE